MNSSAPYLALALGAAMPELLGLAARAGVPIPAYVTAAQTAAMARLNQPIVGVTAAAPTDMQACHRFLEVLRGLTPMRGLASGGLFTWATSLNPFGAPWVQLSPDDVNELASAFVGAATAGAAAGYVLNSSVASAAEVGDAVAWVQATLANADPAAAAAGATDLGAAVLDVTTLQTETSALGTDETAAFDTVAAQRRVWLLAVEMDNQGYLITGKPKPEPTVWGGISAAGDAVAAWTKNVAGDAAGAAVGLVADVALSTPGLLIIGGLIALHVARSA